MFVIDIFPQEETMKEKKTKRRVWRGLATTGTSLLALSLSAAMVIDTFRTDIDKFLGTQSTQMVTDNQTADFHAA